MRLKGKAKAGYYPTPPKVVEAILKLLETREAASALDPCAGTGDVLLELRENLHALGVVGIELSRERVKKAQRKGLTVLQGDSLSFAGEGFGLLWLNPPYDHGEGERLELTFLKHWTPALVEGGVLVYIIPEGSLKATEAYLSSQYEIVGVFRFPEPEYEQFRQVVVLGLKRSIPSHPTGLKPEGSLPAEGPKLTIPPSPSPRLVQENTLPDEEVLEAVAKSPLWDEAKARDFRPLLPLLPAHLALMLAGGLMDGQVVRWGGKPYLVKGRVEKVEVTGEEKLEKETRRITREVFQVSVVALGLLDGEILEVA